MNIFSKMFTIGPAKQEVLILSEATVDSAMFDKLIPIRTNYLLNLKPKDFAQRLAHYLSEINALHPFREGNGRVQRIFISQLAENAAYNLDYSALDQASLYPVMQASFHGDEVPLTDLILRIIA
jgi:cell filamentation protein